jgi:hypothetical protein
MGDASIANPKQSVKKKLPIKDVSGDTLTHQTSILLYSADDKAINAVSRKALDYNLRLSSGQIIRMLIRRASTESITKEELMEAAKQDDRRRVAKKK